MLKADALSCIEGSDLDGIHLFWAANWRGGHSLGGYNIWRRRSKVDLEIICFDLTPDELDRLHTSYRLEKKPTLISLRAGAKPQAHPPLPGEPTTPGPKRPVRGNAERSLSPITGDIKGMPEGRVTPPADAALDHLVDLIARPATVLGANPLLREAIVGQGCLVYGVTFDQSRLMVSAEIGVSGGLAIGLCDGKAVSAEPLTAKGSGAEITFGPRRVDQVLLYVFAQATALRVCYGEILPEKEAAGWEEAELIAAGIQLPFREVNRDLASLDDERRLAESRLLGTESFTIAGFRDLSELMNDAADVGGGESPLCVTAQLRNSAEEPFVEIHPWQYGMALTLSPLGRRMLGFSYLDAGSNLVQGELYDYRIVGTFRRLDLGETSYGFTTVPAGLRLPDVFYLGPLRCATASPTLVEPYPPTAAGSLRHFARKGIRIDGGLTVQFPQPLIRIVLELEPIRGHDLRYEAELLPFVIHGGAVPARRRVVLDFPAPVDRLYLHGTGFLYGIKMTAIPAGDDPEEVVECATTIYGVRYEPTPRPAPPLVLGTTNLQEPPKQGKPEDMAKEPLQDLGFHLYWLPPGTPALWPPDLPKRPKLAVAGFEIERRQLGTGAGFKPIDADEESGLPTIAGGSRTGRAEPRPVFRGADLLALFPDEEPITPPVPVRMELDDVRVSPGRPAGPAPGSSHQYRIYSVDLIGRRSAQPRLGPVRQLEKHRPPPQPAGPVRPPDPPGKERVRPQGVTARVIQASDPLLTLEDKQVLGGAENAIVLQWGWRPEERASDPFAREFRIYFRGKAPDAVTVDLTGLVRPNGSPYVFSARADRAVAADELAGQYLLAGPYPFRVARNTGVAAGGIFEIEFEPSRIKPAAVPRTASVVVMLAPGANEFRPAKWDERTWIESITAEINYDHVFYNRLAVDAAHPVARAWVGVSAADDQFYVTDELAADKANSGRPGNESSIAAVPVVARYTGRPAFAGQPLWDVPTVVLDEVEGETVWHTLDLPALLALPAQQRFQVERIAAGDITGLVGRTGTGWITFTTTAPDGKVQVHEFRYGETPAEPGTSADQLELLGAIASGEPARIASKFLMDILWRFRNDDLSHLWHAVPGTPVHPGRLADSLPNKPERYIYRVRLVDAAGHVSLDAALVPAVYRVPSPRPPAQPEIGKLARDEDRVTVTVTTSAAFDLAGILVFYAAFPAAGGTSPAPEMKPQLLRVPNRRDLYPDAGIRLRLPDGTWTQHIFLPVADALPDLQQPGTLIFKAVMSPGHDRKVAAWTAAVSRDGVPSVPAGPRFTATVPAPPAVPALTVIAEAGRDRVSWALPAAGTSVTIESSTDGQHWQRASPWLEARPALTAYDIAGPPAGPRWYRLRVRVPGREADAMGAPVQT